MVRSMHRCVEHACAGTWWWWCCARACTTHHRGLGTGQRGGHGFRKLRIGKGVVAHVAIVTESAPGYLPRSMPACCTISVRYPCDIRISVRYPYDIHAHGHRDVRARPCAYPPHIQRTSTARPSHIRIPGCAEHLPLGIRLHAARRLRWPF